MRDEPDRPCTSVEGEYRRVIDWMVFFMFPMVPTRRGLAGRALQVSVFHASQVVYLTLVREGKSSWSGSLIHAGPEGSASKRGALWL